MISRKKALSKRASEESNKVAKEDILEQHNVNSKPYLSNIFSSFSNNNGKQRLYRHQRSLDLECRKGGKWYRR